MAMIVSKAGLARELGVTKGRVSQLLRCGLPVRPDGSIDRDLATSWYKSNVVPHNRERSLAATKRAAAPSPGAGVESAGKRAAVPLSADSAGIAHTAVVDAIRRVAASSEVLRLASVA